MATIMPYIPQNPGDLITAENWNQMQVDIRQDIQASIKAAEDDIKAGTVAKAQDATTLEGETLTQITSDNDKRYAYKVHDHEGVAAYRRYFKEFTYQLPDAFLRHGLHRFPIVDTYRLDDVVKKQPTATDAADYTGCKFLFFRKHQDADPYGLYVSSGRDNELLGVQLDELVKEYNVDVKDDDSIEDAIGDTWDEVFKAPSDKIQYCQTPWVKECCDKSRTVGDLKKSGDWPDLYIAMRPLKCGMTSELTDPPCLAEVDQVNYDTIFVRLTADFIKSQNETAVLMFLLRS
jgi:hypothetical protein